MKKIIYIAIYIVCFIATIFIYGSYQKNLFVLVFNNEKILGEIINIEKIHRPRSGSYNRIYYVFDYNGEKYTRSITKNTGGLGGIINNFNSLFMNRHYNIGQKIQVLYNDELKFSYVSDELLSRIILIIILIIFLPFIALIMITGIKSIFIEYLQKIKHHIIYKNKMIFYIQDNNYKIKESVIDGIFDYKKLLLKRLIDGTILCYGIKKGNDFMELSYFDNNYIFRIYKKGNEEEIINYGNKNVKEHFEELVNGL